MFSLTYGSSTISLTENVPAATFMSSLPVNEEDSVFGKLTVERYGNKFDGKFSITAEVESDGYKQGFLNLRNDPEIGEIIQIGVVVGVLNEEYIGGANFLKGMDIMYSIQPCEDGASTQNFLKVGNEANEAGYNCKDRDNQQITGLNLGICDIGFNYNTDTEVFKANGCLWFNRKDNYFGKTEVAVHFADAFNLRVNKEVILYTHRPADETTEPYSDDNVLNLEHTWMYSLSELKVNDVALHTGNNTGINPDYGATGEIPTIERAGNTMGSVAVPFTIKVNISQATNNGQTVEKIYFAGATGDKSCADYVDNTDAPKMEINHVGEVIQDIKDFIAAERVAGGQSSNKLHNCVDTEDCYNTAKLFEHARFARTASGNCEVIWEGTYEIQFELKNMHRDYVSYSSCNNDACEGQLSVHLKREEDTIDRGTWYGKGFNYDPQPLAISSIGVLEPLTLTDTQALWETWGTSVEWKNFFNFVDPDAEVEFESLMAKMTWLQPAVYVGTEVLESGLEGGCPTTVDVPLHTMTTLEMIEFYTSRSALCKVVFPQTDSFNVNHTVRYNTTSSNTYMLDTSLSGSGYEYHDFSKFDAVGSGYEYQTGFEYPKCDEDTGEGCQFAFEELENNQLATNGPLCTNTITAQSTDGENYNTEANSFLLQKQIGACVFTEEGTARHPILDLADVLNMSKVKSYQSKSDTKFEARQCDDITVTATTGITVTEKSYRDLGGGTSRGQPGRVQTSDTSKSFLKDGRLDISYALVSDSAKKLHGTQIDQSKTIMIGLGAHYQAEAYSHILDYSNKKNLNQDHLIYSYNCFPGTPMKQNETYNANIVLPCREEEIDMNKSSDPDSDFSY